MTIDINDERAQRISKIEVIKSFNVEPYADKFEKKQDCGAAAHLSLRENIKTAGRVVLLRDMGKIAFAHLQDISGKIQVVFRAGEMSDEQFQMFKKIVQMGDFIGVEGELGKTQKGELSVFVKSFVFLSKALRGLPEKWHGLKDVEIKYRKRYLDLIANEEAREVFKFRSDFIRSLREFYYKEGFSELDTPILCNTASGALAKPFITHYNALDLDVYLRIAPEIFLKEAIVGGYEKVFEIARCFRNEGMDPSHLQDFSMVEHYSAYWDFKQNMEFTQKMFQEIIMKLRGSLKIKLFDRDGNESEVDLTPPWRQVSFNDLVREDCGIDLNNFDNAKALADEIKKHNIKIDDMDNLGLGNLMDALYKEVSRKKLINPTFLINHPIELSPLARRNSKNPRVADRFQLVINGWEVVNAYSELIDPIDQAARFDEQLTARQKGDEEAMLKDDDYIEAMEYGMPPVSGWGMGIERIVALLCRQSNLRDVVLFPLLRPEE